MKNEVHKCFKAQHLEHKAAKQALLDELSLANSSHAAVATHKEVLEAQIERLVADHETHVQTLDEERAQQLQEAHSDHQTELNDASETHERAMASLNADHNTHRAELEGTLTRVNEEKASVEVSAAFEQVCVISKRHHT